LQVIDGVGELDDVTQRVLDVLPGGVQAASA
jgi:adenylate kinase